MRHAIVITLVLLAIIAAGCQVQKQELQQQADAIVEFRTYGGFTPPEFARQELRVEKGLLTYTIFDRSGNQVSQSQATITDKEYQAVIKAFADARFMTLSDRYGEGQIVTDAGTAEISYSNGTASKSVKVEPYVEEAMPKNLQDINRLMLQLIAKATEMPAGEAEKTAERWIENAPTYRFDGYGLRLLDHKQLESYPVQHVLTYEFTSSHAGYGNRQGKVLAQALTRHEIVVRLSGGRIASAILDGKWDEMRQQKTG
ncbi:hypothetical protein HYY74_04825 [Candidatus Woesearchaeota archaeon]|nr:hypothetical protein [Candidatus Woesearchaeota archaeon]